MEIRQATIKDFDEILKIKLEAKEKEREFNQFLKPVRDVKAHYEEYLRNDLSSEWRVVLVAEENSKIIGLIVGKIYRALRNWFYIVIKLPTTKISNISDI